MGKVYLVLEGGQVFEGESFGAKGETVGELVFTTGMGGYIETITDPSYYGQIVLQTFPLIGNYGMIEADMESRNSFLKGYVVKDYCTTPSNFRSEGTLEAFLKEKGIVGICGVDTREITKLIREKGVINAKITPVLSKDIVKQLKEYKILDCVKNVSPTKVKEYAALEKGRWHVVLIDYGAKKNIVRELQARKCAVSVVPYDTSAEEILEMKPDGIMLSNGPGDPMQNTECIEVIKQLLGVKPMFGICLGHQLMALATGAKTEKMKYGHRGANQPVRDRATGRVYITSQNHGYQVVGDSLVKGSMSHENANDGTCEGVDYPEYRAYSLQFHPEACAGPRDTEFLFDKFIRLMKGV